MGGRKPIPRSKEKSTRASAPQPKCRTTRHVCQELTSESRHAFREDELSEWWAAFAMWPPNVFALTSVILGESGSYRRVVSPPRDEVWPPSEDWNERVAKCADEWMRATVAPGPISTPACVAQFAQVLKRSLSKSLRAIPDDWRLCTSILELHAIADAACAGLGIPIDPQHDLDTAVFIAVGNDRLATRGTLAELNSEIIRVLPKLLTPQVGITLRSLSHNLAIQREEVVVHWHYHRSLCESESRRLNLLVLPWPKKIESNAFVPVDGPLRNMDMGTFGFFRFSPKDAFPIDEALAAVKEAQRVVGEVHGLVLPECALTDTEFATLRQTVETEGVSMIVAGVRGPRANDAYFALRSSTRLTDKDLGRREPWRQPKHHRWCINGPQVRGYHLGSALHPSRSWWEDIEIHRRELNFVTANGWLTMCHLICEDLARQEPVAEVVRAVGPTLVIALLLDGPQLESRWPARYASVLADDPGSSVLTVTSLGMALRSKPQGKPESRVVGLWKDAKFGSHELELKPNASGLLLSLCSEEVEHWSADGRPDGKTTSLLFLSGVEQISVPLASPAPRARPRARARRTKRDR